MGNEAEQRQQDEGSEAVSPGLLSRLLQSRLLRFAGEVALVLLVVGAVQGWRGRDLVADGTPAPDLALRDLQGNNLGIGPDYADGLAGEMFNGRKTSIYGGSNEIQRNIIAKAVLGL